MARNGSLVASLVVLSSLLATTPGLGKERPAPCPGGRFRLEAPVATPGGVIDALEFSGGQVQVPGCAPAIAKAKAVKRGTVVAARWQTCSAYPGKVALTAKILPGCDSLRGVLKAAQERKKRFAGRLSRCGDGVLDAAGGEECDPAGCPSGSTCDTASCGCIAPVNATYEVSYTEGTAVIESAVIESHFRRMEDSRFVFGAGAEAVRALQPGQVVLFAGHALRRVVSVAAVGDELVVDTEAALLTDAIADGQIAWKQTVKFDAATVDRAVAMQNHGMAIGPSDGHMRLTHVFDAAEYTFSGAIAGVSVLLKLTPGAERLDIEGTLGYALNDSAHAFSASVKGWVHEFETLGEILVERRRVRNLSLGTARMNGELTLEIDAVRLSTDPFKIPIPVVFPIPIQMGPIPVLLNVRANATIVPVLSGESSSRLKFKLTFDADQGLRVTDEAVTPSGELRNDSISLERAETAGFVPVGLGFGVEFPRIELAVLGNVVVPYASLITAVRSYFTPVLTGPCQDAGATVRGVIGYDLEFFGIKQAAEHELFKKSRFTRRQSSGVSDGECP